MSYPGDITFAFKNPLGSANEPNGIECHNQARQYRLVTQTDGGFSFSDGRKFMRFEVAPGDQTGDGTTERCMVRNDPLGPPYNEVVGDHVFYGVRTLLDAGFNGGSLFVLPFEGHGTGGFPGNYAYRQYGGGDIAFSMDCGSYPNPTPPGSDGSHNPPTRTVGTWAPTVNEFIVEVMYTDQSNGIVQMWQRAQGQTDFTLLAGSVENGPTVQTINGIVGGSYLEIGVYRGAAAYTDVAYFDTFVRRSSFANAKAWMDLTSAGGGGGGGGGGGTGALIQAKERNIAASGQPSISIGSAQGLANFTPGAGLLIRVQWGNATDEALSALATANGESLANGKIVEIAAAHTADTVHGWITRAYFVASNAGGTPTVTATFLGNRGFPLIAVEEVNGVGSVDIATATKQVVGVTGTDAMTSGAVVTTAAGDYVSSSMVNTTGLVSQTVAQGTNYGILVTDPTFGYWSEGQTQAAAGSIGGTWTMGSPGTSQWTIDVIALKPSATPVPVNTTPPTIQVQAQVGGTLSVASLGAWTNSPTAYTYTWYRNGVAVSTAATYTLTAADVGQPITLAVVATNAGGASLPAVASNQVLLSVNTMMLQGV